MALRLTKFEYDRLQNRSTPQAAQLPAEPEENRWEKEFARQLVDAGYYRRFERQHYFARPRRFRFDFAFPAELVAVEVDGAVHRIKERFHADRERGNIALLLGWRVLHVGADQVRSGEALTLLTQLLQTVTAANDE